MASNLYPIVKADKTHLSGIINLLNQVNLPQEGIQTHISDFIVSIHDATVIGCAGIEVYETVGLLRSVAVHPDYQGKAIGNALIRMILSHAQKRRIEEIFLLTETAEKYFLKLGFKRINRDDIDYRIKETQEFKTLCPASAISMHYHLSSFSNNTTKFD
ncbi:MAG: arsenic resistance N-acetyltransferase ArsN2 [Candidatus Hermodarchaeota archaeon]